MQDRITQWTFRDVFLSLTLALDPVLLAVAYVGLMTAGAAYGFFYFLGAATSDPGAQGTAAIFGGIVSVGIWIVAAGILARLVATKLLEGRSATAREIWEYMRSRARVLLMIPAAFAAIVLAALGSMGMLELAGRLPLVGPIIFGASFTLIFLLGLVAVVAFVVHTLAGLLYPAILAIRTEGLLGTVGEILTLARQKGPLLLIYSAVILTAGTAATLFLLSVVWLSLSIVTASAQSLMGDGFQSVLSGLPSWFRPFLDLFSNGIGIVPIEQEVPFNYDIGGLLLGISLLSIFAATAAYPLVMVNAAGTIAYFILTDDKLPLQVPMPGARVKDIDEAVGLGSEFDDEEDVL
jgi:hypothetical protein